MRSELTDDDVRTAIKNSGGIKGSLLIPEAPFELLVRRAIERLLPPALQCKDFVHGELLRIASQCAPPEVRRFQILGVSGEWRGALWRLGGCGVVEVRRFQILGVSAVQLLRAPRAAGAVWGLWVLGRFWGCTVLAAFSAGRLLLPLPDAPPPTVPLRRACLPA